MTTMEDAELIAIKTIYSALEPLDEAARRRTLAWVADRLEITRAPSAGNGAGHGSVAEDEGGVQFSNVAELVDAAQPSTGAERALAVAYWFQVIEGREGWSGGDVNSQLKELGHGLANVTVALNRLMNRKPSLVIQTARSGRSAQSRKTYKLTSAGLRKVQTMLAGAGDESD
jgi:hypothetical protein